MKNNFLKFIIIILVGIAVFIACQKEILDFVDPGDFSIEQAKSWFIKQNPEFIDLGSTNQKGMTIVAKPDWDIASRGKDIGYNYVETDLRTSSSVILMDNQTKNDWANVTKYEGMFASITRLVVRQNKKDKSIESYIINMVPTKDWLVNNPERLKETHYYDLPKDYSGIVFYKDMKGNFLNGWKYTDGKVTHKVTQSSDKPTKNSKSDCYPIDIWILWGDCAWNSSGEVVFCYSTWWILADTYEVCFETQEDEEEEGGDDGSSSPSYVGLISSSSSTLNTNQNQLLESAIDEFIDYCDIFNQIWQDLINYSIRIKFYTKSDLAGAAGMDPYTGDIVFKNDDFITRFCLAEELIHRYQKLMYGYGHDPYINTLEFEAKVLQDYCDIIHDGVVMYRAASYLPESLQSAYMDWLEILRNGGSFTMEDFNRFAPYFTYPSPPGNYNDPNYIPEILINALNNY